MISRRRSAPSGRAPWAMARMVTTIPPVWTGERAWPSTTQPMAAPVAGAASPNRGGATAGSRLIPLNQSTNATAVPARLR